MTRIHLFLSFMPWNVNIIRVSAFVLLITVAALVVKVREVYALHVVEYVALDPGGLMAAQRTNVGPPACLDIVVQALTGHTCNKNKWSHYLKFLKYYKIWNKKTIQIIIYNNSVLRFVKSNEFPMHKSSLHLYKNMN